MLRIVSYGLLLGLLSYSGFSCQSSPGEKVEGHRCKIDPLNPVVERIDTLMKYRDTTALFLLLDSVRQLEEPNTEGEVLYAIGKTYGRLGAIPQKITYYHLALEQYALGKPVVLERLARLSNNVANGFLITPGKQDSLVLVSRAAISRLLTFADCPAVNELMVELYQMLGKGLRDQGDYAAAHYQLKEGERLCQDSSLAYWRCGRLLTELAKVQLDIEELAEAQTTALRARNLFSRASDWFDSTYLADIYDTEFAIAWAGANAEATERAAQSSIALNRLVRPSENFMGHSYNNLALANIMNKNYKRAEKLLDSARLVYRMRGTDHDLGSCYENYADIFAKRGDTLTALRYLDSAEVVYHGDPAQPELSYAIDYKELKDPVLERAKFSLLLHGSRPRQFPLSEVSYRVARIDSVFGFLQRGVRSEISKRENIKQLREFYETVVAFGYTYWQRTGREEYLNFGRSYLERSKGRILRERRRNTFAGLDKDGGRANDAIFAARSRLSGIQSKLRVASVSERSDLQLQKERAQNALWDKVDLGNRLSQVNFVERGSAARIEMMAKNLRPGQLVLDYLLGEKSAFVSYTSATDRGLLRLPLRTPEIIQQIDKLKQGLEARGRIEWDNERSFRLRELAKYRESARLLYDVLLEPVLHSLPQTDHVTVIPDGPLGFVPFGALLSAAPADNSERKLSQWPFALNSLTFNYEFSVDLWADRSERPYTGGRQCLVIDPVQQEVETFSGAGFSGPQRLAPLGTGEAQEVKLVTDARLLRGKEAGKLRHDLDLTPYGILHFTGHGLASPSDPYLSMLVLELGPGSQEEVLRLNELEALPLNLQMLVLSACQTGVGEVAREEGVICLGRAGAIAGARSVVTSLWYVNQAAKEDLFRRFYVALAEGRARDQALRLAQRGQLRSGDAYQHPYYWAGFLNTGDGSPLERSFFTGYLPGPAADL